MKQQNKSCVIFAASINYEHKLYVLHELLNFIKSKYGDCKVFIGINYGSHADIEQIINSYNLNCVYERLQDSSLHVASDDSAYQLALKLFYADPIKYEICWFMHTKGGFNSRDAERKMYIDDFYSRRAQIENKFESHKYLGVYGYRAIEYGADPLNPVDPYITNDFMKALWGERHKDDFFTNFSKLIIVETMFALNASLMYKFLDRYKDFFTTKLRMFFFECEISNFLSSRSGHYQCLVKGNLATNASMESITEDWVHENELTHLQNYKESVKL